MRAGVIVTGVLGVGTALVFGAAALVFALFPNGSTVAAGWNGGMMWKGGMVAPAMPVPAPFIAPANGVIGTDDVVVSLPESPPPDR
jgi:hypothetical protein